MKTHKRTNSKGHIGTWLKKCSVIAFSSLLMLGSFAQADGGQQENTNETAVNKTKVAVVNLNNSSIEQLVTLKGIGQKRAQAIIAYREQVGQFKSVAELIQVKGVGEKVLSDNKARLQI